MHESEPTSCEALRPRLTVAAIVEREGRFLLVRERAADGELVINQPAGHVEAGESLVEAAIRETREETGWKFVPQALVGVYQWRHPREPKSFVRFAVCGAVTHRDDDPVLDQGIEEVVWLSFEEVLRQAESLRSPMVLRGIRDYLGGERFPLALLKQAL